MTEVPAVTVDSLVADLQEVRPDEEAEREEDKRALTAAPALPGLLDLEVAHTGDEVAAAQRGAKRN